MARAHGRLGHVLPNDPTKPRVVLKRHPSVDPTPPASVDFYSAVPAASWGMLGNDTAGDCTFASEGHTIDQVVYYAQNDTPAPITTAEAIAGYSAVSGYNPRTGANDNGCTLQEVLAWTAKNGLGGYKPAAFAQIDITDQAVLKQAVASFGSCYAALQVPAAFMSQFDAGEPWDVPTTRAGGKIEGGHAVPVVGFTADSTGALQYWVVVTWAAVQLVTPAAFDKYFDEAWVQVFDQWVESSGVTPSGLDGADANAQYQALTGSTVSPFPVVNPTPPTPPVPPVGPDADAADQALYAAIEACVQPFSTLQAAFAAWAADHGFHASGDVPPHVHGH